jgi:hypothetical protein
MKLISLAASLGLASLAVASLVLAADLPSGESLIQRCIEREGGASAIERAQSAMMTGTVELVGHNISGPLEIYQQGDKAYTGIELPGIGKIEEGFDGEVAWESNLLQGPRIKDGEELAAAKRASRMSVLGAWKDYYKAAVTAGEEDVNGKPAWKVDMTPTEGAVEQFFFDRESGLMVKMTQTLATALGDIPVEMTIGDYRVVDGIQTPFLMTQSAMNQTMAMHIDKVVYNADIPAGRFDLPPAVKAIAAKKKP